MMSRLKWPFSVSVLALVLVLFEPARILAEVQALHPGWLAIALAVTALQTLLSAWRWRFTVARLGLELPWRQALGDYYLAGFANQTLPGGVLGDAWRAQRHAGWQEAVPQKRRKGRRGAAWRAVLIERGSGQVLVVVLSVFSLLMLARWQGQTTRLFATLAPDSLTGMLAVAACGAVLVCGLAVLTRGYWQRHWILFRADVQRALLSRGALAPQLASSLLIVMSYAAVFALAARAIGVDLPTAILLSLALPVLLAMLIPLSIAGWGWREAMAGGLWLGLGLPPEQGVAVSMAYGGIVFLGATPGLLVWLTRPDHPSRVIDSPTDQQDTRMSTSTTSSSPRG